jgi:mannose-1-phosphate guanylyltransferase
MNGITSSQSWAIVLAGGDGTRLRTLAIDRGGNTIPKQFCSLNGGASLVSQTVARAKSVVGVERITAIVSAAHDPYWRAELRMLPRRNVVVQPMNRGTGIGLLLPTLRILERDPEATILILPSDHHVADEGVLQAAMRSALAEVRSHPSSVTFCPREHRASSRVFAASSKSPPRTKRDC